MMPSGMKFKAGKELITIQISKETMEILKELGKKGETYNVIRRLIEANRPSKTP